jgi:predicted enzyme related to lactoylglutathione lyase
MYGTKLGDMVWMDLSVANAVEVKDFYQGLFGWKSQGIGMDDQGEKYEDFEMVSPAALKKEEPQSKSSAHVDNQEGVPSQDFSTGICHSKGANADIPAAWLPYFLVENINVAVQFVNDNDGDLVTSIKSLGEDQFCVIKDPAGAMCALYQKG